MLPHLGRRLEKRAGAARVAAHRPHRVYQGTRGWTYSTEFADLFPEAARAWPWIPRFAHVLLDQTGLAPEAVAGNVKTRIVQLLMMAAFGHRAPEALRLAANLASLPEAGGESNLDMFLLYLTTMQESEGIDTFKETMQHHGIDIGVKADETLP